MGDRLGRMKVVFINDGGALHYWANLAVGLVVKTQVGHWLLILMCLFPQEKTMRGSWPPLDRAVSIV